MAELVTRRNQALGGGIKSLYLGGGTPSKLGGDGIADLIHRIASVCGVEKFSTNPNELEVTIEANPEDVSVGVAERWVAAGVNRVSLGVQSFDPNVLDWMHRAHGPARAAEAVSDLRRAGVQEISVDLIFALPEALGRSWTDDLLRAIELDSDHISLYGLTVESQTPLGRWKARGEVAEAPEERYEAEFLEAHERLAEAGFEHYEVSNYAKPGRRARHNSAYWSGAAYLGLGPSAHGFDGVRRRWNASAYADWLRRVQAGEDPIEGEELIGSESAAAERVYLGLRTIDGLELRDAELLRAEGWIAAGWATLSGRRLRLTPQGWLRLDALVAQLL